MVGLCYPLYIVKKTGIAVYNEQLNFENFSISNFYFNRIYGSCVHTDCDKKMW